MLEFQYAARTYLKDWVDCYNMLTNFHDEDIIPTYLERGRAIYRYLHEEAKQIYSKKFSVFFKGKHFAVVNRERFNPVNFGIDYHKDGYEGFACFWWTGKVWMFSLYNDDGKVDCSEICKQYGGGGHKGAAGFTVLNVQEFLEL